MATASAVHDEEEALMPPHEVAACLVQELWQALRASLEAQARHRSAHTAAAPLIFISPSLFGIHCRRVHLVAHAVCR